MVGHVKKCYGGLTWPTMFPAFISASRSDHEPSSANHNAAFPSDGIDIGRVHRGGGVKNLPTER